jgi:hypothetical protein
MVLAGGDYTNWQAPYHLTSVASNWDIRLRIPRNVKYYSQRIMIDHHAPVIYNSPFVNRTLVFENAE